MAVKGQSRVRRKLADALEVRSASEPGASSTTEVIDSRVVTDGRATRPAPARPRFLDLLAENPDCAFPEFYNYCWNLLERRPPPLLRRMPPQGRKEVISETIGLCWEKDQRVLRSYNERMPFPQWLALQANKAARAYGRKECGFQARRVSDPEDPNLEEVGDLRLPSEERIRLQMLYRQAVACFERLGEYCRQLLIGASNELTPQDLAIALMRPPEHAKAISNHLRWCRRKLKELLQADGIDCALPD